MAQTPQDIQQQIAAQEQKLARLKDKARKLEAGQKVVLGGALLSAARQDDRYRQFLIELAQKHVTRKADIERLAPLIEELGGKLEAPGGASDKSDEKREEGASVPQ